MEFVACISSTVSRVSIIFSYQTYCYCMKTLYIDLYVVPILGAKDVAPRIKIVHEYLMSSKKACFSHQKCHFR